MVLGAVVGALGTVKQMQAQKKAAKQEKKKAEGAKRQTNVEAEQTRRRTLRERMIAQGQVMNQAANSGVGLGGTSGFQGAMSSLGSQSATNVAEVNRTEGSSIAMANAQSKIVQSMNRAEQWGKVASFGGSVMSNASSIADGGKSIFKIK